MPAQCLTDLPGNAACMHSSIKALSSVRYGRAGGACSSSMLDAITSQLQHGTIEARSVAAEKLFSYAAEHEPARACVASPPVVQALVKLFPA